MAAATAMVATMIAGPAGATAGDAGAIGSLSGLFEESPDEPFCEQAVDADGESYVTCKPTAVSAAVLDDGSLVYWNGIENTEGNVDTLVLFEAGQVLRDSRVRGLDLNGDAPSWRDIAFEDVSNPVQSYDSPVTENPLGVIGTGKPGDGIVGSTVGRVVSTDASAPHDDSTANDADMFCSDLALLPDGTIIVAGGSDFYATGGGVPEDQPGIGGFGVSEIEGIKTTQLYDGESGTWSQTDAMDFGRWYPTLTTMSNGDPLAVSGVTRLVFDSQLGQVRLGESYDVSEGVWKTLDEAGLASETSLPMYPRVHMAPSGDLFYAAAGQMNGFGPTGYGADEALWGLYQLFDTESQTWSIAGATQWAGAARNGVFSTALLMEPNANGAYDRMDILQGGGTLGSTPGSMVAMSLSEIISVDAENNVSSRATSTMQNPRWYTSGTLLPDGTVLATGGGTVDAVNASGYEGPVRQMELFDPATESWSPLMDLQRDRVYHNTATLLQDGRVLIGGHSPIMQGVVASHQDFGGAMARNTKDPTFEVYSPAYLHAGTRPTITDAPALLEWKQDFEVEVESGDDIDSFTLIRTPSVSHTIDSDQRGLVLPAVSRTDTDVSVDFSGVDGNAAPPGEYYLFAMSSEGVPSVAAIVTVADDSVDDAFAPGQLDAMRAASASLNTSMNSAVAAEAGDAQPYEEGNVLEALLDRQYPAPGLEEVLVEMFEGAAPEQIRSALADYSPQGYERLTDILSPLGLIEELEAAMGRDPMARGLINQGWEMFGDPGTEAFQEGTRQLGAALSDAATAGASGTLQNPGLDYGMLQDVPLPDEPLVNLGGDETEPPMDADQMRAESDGTGVLARMWTGFLDWFR
ncbi:MAG: hypothetical protein ACJA2H_000901 [Nitriliruptoraceae bacterium]